MVSEKFRHQLRQEATHWRDEALISPELFTQLSDRYQFEQLDRSAHNRFVMILLGLGAVLLGLAAITFVAANWQAWSRWARVALMMSLFVGVNSGGFMLWRKPQPGWSRLGQALLLLGGLLIGANIGLFSQMFHQTGNLYELYLIWGLAVLGMAYSLRLTILGVLAMVLMMLGNFMALSYTTPSTLWRLVLDYFPLVSLGLFLPLAVWCASRWLAGLTLVLASTALQVVLVRAIEVASRHESWLTPYLLLAATSLLPLLLWAYRDRRWPRLAPNLAVFYLGLWCTIFAYYHWWRFSPTLGTVGLLPELVPPLINLGSCALLALWLWWRLGFAGGTVWRLHFTSPAFALACVSLGSLAFWHGLAGPLRVFGPLWCNALLAMLAIACLHQVLERGQRLYFWWNMLLLVGQVLARMLEYDTGLLAKALVLFLCGIGVIGAGLWFEHYVRRPDPTTVMDRSTPAA